MTYLVQYGADENNEVKCTECDAVFTIIWQRTYMIRRVEYCPFCGDEVVYEEDEESE